MIPVRLARMLDEYDDEHDVVHEDEVKRFKPETPDVEMIKALAKENPKPVLVTCDVNMLSRDAIERKALSESGLTVVFFRKTLHNLSFHEQTLKAIKAWPDIVKATTRCKEPTAFEVTVNGKVKRICRTRDL